MNYPVWDVPVIGGGILIGIIAILHVFISHFAVGGGIYLALTERKAIKEKDQKLIEYLKKHSKFFLLLTVVLGALSGVGIWFAIGLVHPSATSTLIHSFVFGWAIEWVFFIVEIAAVLIYYATWDKLDPKTHNIIGWIYAAGAYLSLVIINGILTFMLTSGGWINIPFTEASKKFWVGFFNPSYFPSLIIRTGVALALAGLYSLITATHLKDEETRVKLIQYDGKWIMAAFILIPLGGVWYISVIPPLARDIIAGGAPAVTIFAGLSLLFSIIIALFSWIGPIKAPKQTSFGFALGLLVMGFLVTAVTEWMREAIRKPYIIYEYMYSNSVIKAHGDKINEIGSLNFAKWVTVKEVNEENMLKAGEEIYKIQCQSCHTVDGYNGIKQLVKGWTEEYIDLQLQYLDMLKGYMPPFFGTEQERKALAKWLYSLNNEEKTKYGFKK
ncbi:MAG: cytochrome ubiquinol oxidase subunit I [Candidatus Kryptonium sp.]